jgi:uncharacterized phage protein gp47/JayE
MEINYPSDRKVVVDRAKTDVQAALPDSEPFLPRAYINALITGYGGRIYENYDQLKILQKQMFPDTATGAFALRWGSYKGVPINPASQAQGPTVVTGAAGTILPINEQFNSPSGKQYLTLSEVEMAAVSISISSLTRSGSTVTATAASNHNLATGMTVTISGAAQTDYNGSHVIVVTSLTQFTYSISTTPITPATGTITAGYTGASVDFKSVDTGKDTNQPSGAQLTIATPMSGIDSIARVQFSEIGGGTDAEDDDDYKKRYLIKYKKPHALFNKPEIESKAKEVPGVTRVWVYVATPVPGDVTVYFTRDNDEDIIPDPSEVLTVKNKLLEIKPAPMEDDDVHVSAPTSVEVDFTFTTLVPNTLAMQTAITANLTLFFKEGTNVATNLVEDAYRAEIYQTVDATGAKVQSFTLSAPSGDVTIGDGEIPTLGDIAFP